MTLFLGCRSAGWLYDWLCFNSLYIIMAALPWDPEYHGMLFRLHSIVRTLYGISTRTLTTVTMALQS